MWSQNKTQVSCLRIHRWDPASTGSSPVQSLHKQPANEHGNPTQKGENHQNMGIQPTQVGEQWVSVKLQIIQMKMVTLRQTIYLPRESHPFEISNG